MSLLQVLKQCYVESRLRLINENTLYRWICVYLYYLRSPKPIYHRTWKEKTHFFYLFKNDSKFSPVDIDGNQLR